MAGRLILPGAANRPKDGLTIVLPRSVAAELEREREEKIGVCLVCGAKFFKGQETVWQRHVGNCARENLDALMAANPSRVLPFLDEANWDPEISEHMRKVGERMTKEGRLTVRPSERAGF